MVGVVSTFIQKTHTLVNKILSELKNSVNRIVFVKLLPFFQFSFQSEIGVGHSPLF